MANATASLPTSRSHAAILNEAASRYSVYGVFIASAALVIATLLVAWLSEGAVSVATIADAQQQNIALWCMDAMPFIFALWGQYASSRMAREADDIISARTRVFTEALAEAHHTNQAKTDFFARISHELRTPLNAIVGMADMLLEPASAEETRRYAQTVRESAENLLTLINDILDIAKIEAGRMELEQIEFDLRECVRGAITLLLAQAEHKGLKLTSLVAPDIPARAVGDPGRLRQIIINLVGNAIKYTSAGEVVFTLSHSGTPDADPMEFRVEVADTGVGISASAQRELFKAYQQVGTGSSRHGGTGLGLAITRELVESMYGRIGVDSKVGKGSTFWCTMQLRRAKPQPKAAASPPAASLEGRRILLADPNESSRQGLSAQLRTLGMDVITAATSDEANAAVQNAMHKNRPFDIILLDLFLPGENGEAMGQRLLAEGESGEALIAIITSTGARGDAERMAREGFAAYLTRPIPPDGLKPLLERILALRGLGAEERRRVGLVTRHSQPGPLASGEQRKRVLLVEDSEAGRVASMRQLTNMGLSVDIAVTGSETLEAAGRRRYGVILLDLQLPDMNGTQVLRWLRGNVGTQEQCPVVIMTAGATEAEHKRCRELGANHILTKPVDNYQLRTVLAQWLDIPVPAGPALRNTAGTKTVQVLTDTKMIEIFLAESDRRMKIIRRASTDTEGRDQIAREAHTLVSTSRYVGGDAAALAAARVQAQARNGTEGDLRKAVRELVLACEELRERLQALLARS